MFYCIQSNIVVNCWEIKSAMTTVLVLNSVGNEFWNHQINIKKGTTHLSQHNCLLTVLTSMLEWKYTTYIKSCRKVSKSHNSFDKLSGESVFSLSLSGRPLSNRVERWRTGRSTAVLASHADDLKLVTRSSHVTSLRTSTVRGRPLQHHPHQCMRSA